MPVLQVFFDYACPYCQRGHANLLALIPMFPDIQVEWHPCEAHPRPETYGPHSDLCIQGMFFAHEHGADLWAYHARMYHAALEARINIESIDAVCAAVSDLLDADALRKALTEGAYVDALQRANDYAYEQSGVWAVPAYRMEGRRLDAVEDVGVTQEQLRKFLAAARG